MYIKQRDAVKIYYYMIAVDGEIKESEIEKFKEIGMQTDASFLDYSEKVIAECGQQLEKVIDEDEYLEVIEEEIDKIFDKDDQLFFSEDDDFFENDVFSKKIEASNVLWNLLCIATSDKEYSSEEQKLIRYLVRKLKIDKDVYMEMENAMKAIQNIDRTIAMLSDRDSGFVMKRNHCEIYSSAIGETVKQYAERRDVIFNSVKELIAD